MRPEMPYLAAGILAIVGGIRKGNRPAPQTVAAIVFLVILASMSAGGKLAPVVRGLGFILLLSVSITVVPGLSSNTKES